MAGLLLSELDQSMVAAALPTIVDDLDGVGDLMWVNTAYLLTGTGMLPVLGGLGDLLGRRPVFLAALGGPRRGLRGRRAGPDLTTLVAARAVQGLGGGGLLVLVYAVLADLLPARAAPR